MTNYHLGSREHHFEDFVNVDLQGSDMNLDLSKPFTLPDAHIVFSNAFLEHLHPDHLLTHLACLRSSLVSDGFAIYTGLPDFYVIATQYITMGAGTSGPVMDLYNVWRYTHGAADPGDYVQLHKSLFDPNKLYKLLVAAGFHQFDIFHYCCPGETVALCMGFSTGPWYRTVGVLTRHATKHVDISTLQRTLKWGAI